MENKLKSKIKPVKIICDYILNECKHDEHLADRVMREDKTVDGMHRYILTAVKNKFKDQIKNNVAMVKDEDIYNLAIHYFIEDNETLEKEFKDKVTNAEVKANSKPVEKTKIEEPKKETKSKKEDEFEQLSLFDFGVEV